ncbi:hypothetical protein B0E48_12990 [Rhodanobacter sp. C03]|nr:hypothetical protein B0E48_12990 [Rhodanobacter sp. C03]
MAMPARMRWLTFFRQWLKNPRSMASVAPSGRQLGALMAAALPSGVRHIVELGAGTGAITDAVVRHGIPQQQLLAVEMNPVLHELLARRFPQLHLAHGDARHLPELVDRSGAFVCGEVDAVLSSLGLLSMPKELQHDILDAAFKVLRAGGVFIQYTYGLTSPLNDEVRQQLGLRSTSVGLAWRNLPPARVFVYTRS